MRDRAAINAWLDTLPASVSLQLNSPLTIMEKWRDRVAFEQELADDDETDAPQRTKSARTASSSEGRRPEAQRSHHTAGAAPKGQTPKQSHQQSPKGTVRSPPQTGQDKSTDSHSTATTPPPTPLGPRVWMIGVDPRKNPGYEGALFLFFKDEASTRRFVETHPTLTVNEPEYALQGEYDFDPTKHVVGDSGEYIHAAYVLDLIKQWQERNAELEKQLAAAANPRVPILTQPLPPKINLSDEKKLKGRELVEKAFHTGNTEPDVISYVRAYHRQIGDWSPSDLGIGSYDAQIGKLKEDVLAATTQAATFTGKYFEARAKIDELNEENKKLRSQLTTNKKGRVHA
jgi:hypothetical protein